MNLGFNSHIRKLYSAANFYLISNLIKSNHVDKLRISKVEITFKSNYSNFNFFC